MFLLRSLKDLDIWILKFLPNKHVNNILNFSKFLKFLLINIHKASFVTNNF